MSDDRITQVVSELKKAKEQGLTYVQATEALKSAGFSQSEVLSASYQFPYSGANLSDAPKAPGKPVSDQAYSKMGSDLLREQQMNGRFISYVAGMVIMGSIAAKLFDLYWIGPGHLARGVGFYVVGVFLAWIFGAALGFVVIKLSARRRDNSSK